MVPLLFMNTEFDKYISDKYGFMNAYSRDINKPQLENHVFLLFKNPKSAVDYMELWNTLPKHPNFYGRSNYKLKGVFYDVYIFTIGCGKFKFDETYLFRGRQTEMSWNTRVKILNYWGYNLTSEECRFLFDQTVTTKITQDVLPELDPPNELQFKADMLQYT